MYILKKKNKLFLKKQIQKLILKKKFNFTLEYKLEYLRLFMILNNFSIIIFAQFISLNSEKDNKYYLTLSDKNIKSIYIKQKLIKKLFNSYFVSYVKNFNTIFCVKNFNTLEILKKNILLNKNILILGYLFNNIFFFKIDFNLKNICKKQIYIKILILKKNFNKLYNKIINLLKLKLKLIILILIKKKKLCLL